MGGRITKRPWIARRRVEALGRTWRVCEGCAELIRIRPSESHLFAPPGQTGGIRANGKRPIEQRQIAPEVPKPRTLPIADQQRMSVEGWLFGEASRLGVEYVDLRPDGALWLIAAEDLTRFIGDCRRMGVPFRFEPEGHPATNGRPGWWTQWPTW